MTQSGAGPRRPPLALLAGVAAVLVAIFLLLPTSGSGPSSASTTVAPVGLSESPPFGRPLPGAIAYLGQDRTFHLVDLVTGRVLGSKGIDSDRRAAGASSVAAFIGNLPRGTPDDGNWDTFRSIPWDGTEPIEHGSGLDIVYSERLNAVARAMRPLPGEEGNGIRITGEAGSFTAAASTGYWSLPVWAGDRLLARELIGEEVNWWLLDAANEAAPVEAPLPDEFVAIAGTDGLVMGELDGDGVIIDLASGKVSTLTGRWSWAAEWRPMGPPLLATVGGTDPVSLVAYTPNGLFDWSVPLADPTTHFTGGVSWGRDGSFVITASRGTLEAYTDTGGTIGSLDASLPTPQASQDGSFLAVVPRP